MKKLISFCVIALLLIASVSIGQAGDYHPYAFEFLKDGYVHIAYLGNGEISAYGLTTAVQNVDEITVRVVIQQWNGSYWYDYTTIEQVNYNDSEARVTRVVVVPRNNSYRLKGVHTVRHGDTFETAVSISPSIYAD